MNLEGKNVLVTGACGFIGSHLVERLVELGALVKGFVHYNSFNSWGWLENLPEEKLRKVEVVTGDVRDFHCVRRAMSETELVFHLAALIAIPYSYVAPESYVDTNIKGTLNVLQAAREIGVSKVIHTSTSEVYGTAQYVPIDEKHPLQGQSPYSATKIAADMLALSFYHSFDLPVVICRPFNTYGPRQSARAIIPTIITQLMDGYKEIRLGALHPTRDLNYVKDIVEGFIAMAEAPDVIGEVINLGSNQEISVGKLAEKIIDLIGSSVEITSDSDRLRPENSEVQRLMADNSKAKHLLGWEPKYDMETGLRETIQWFEQNRHNYKAGIYNV